MINAFLTDFIFLWQSFIYWTLVYVYFFVRSYLLQYLCMVIFEHDKCIFNRFYFLWQIFFAQ